jgi:hypothetical protein
LKKEKQRLETLYRTHEIQCKKQKFDHGDVFASAISACHNDTNGSGMLTANRKDVDVSKLDIDTELLPPQTSVELATPLFPDKTFMQNNEISVSQRAPLSPATLSEPLNNTPKADNDDDESFSIDLNKESPMISGNTNNTKLTSDIQNEFQLERPRNLSLSSTCMLFGRNDSGLTFATPIDPLNTPSLSHHQSSLLNLSTQSPTITLNTPILTLAPVENTYSPTSSANPQRIALAILKPFS